jgi:hypothetical protein
MTILFRKETDEEGNEVLVEVDLATVELPENHPTSVKLATVTQESIRRRNKINEYKKAAAQVEAADDVEGETPETPVTTPPVNPPVATDPDTLVETILERLERKQVERTKADTDRKAIYDGILADSGLSETYRPVIEAIPDPVVAKAQASLLAKQVNRFDDPAREGNGARDAASLLKKASSLLGELD